MFETVRPEHLKTTAPTCRGSAAGAETEKPESR